MKYSKGSIAIEAVLQPENRLILHNEKNEVINMCFVGEEFKLYIE